MKIPISINSLNRNFYFSMKNSNFSKLFKLNKISFCENLKKPSEIRLGNHNKNLNLNTNEEMKNKLIGKEKELFPSLYEKNGELKDKDNLKPAKLEENDLILNPNSENYLETMKKLPRKAQHIEFHKFMILKENFSNKKRFYMQRFIVACTVLVIGIYAFWVPLYRVVCEHAGLLTKTTVASYKDSKKFVDTTRKYTVNFHNEVDPDLPWEFYPQQDHVLINAGETCLIFYKARNKTDQPIVGLSVYDVHPQSAAFYFNKIQCFCFENQMLGPKEEVDLPVLFYLDPAIQEDKYVVDAGYFQLNLKYTFYFAKSQDLAKIMKKRLDEEKKNEEELNKRKQELNRKHGYEKYIIEESTNTLPGVNPLLKESKLLD